MRRLILALLALLLLGACGREEKFQTFEFPAMGATVHGEVGVWDRTQRRSPIEMIHATLDSVSAQLDAGRRGSMIDQINTVPVDSLLQLDKWTSQALRVAELLREVSDGAFDPSGGRPQGYTHDPFRRTLVRHAADLKLDLGGLMRGFAVDQAIANLIEMGISSARLELGDVQYCLGVNDGDPWTILIPQPGGAQPAIASLKTWNMAIASVSNPGNALLSATVLAPQATLAEGLASTLMTLTPQQAVELLRTRYSHLRAVLVLPAEVGHPIPVYATGNLRDNLTLTPDSRAAYRLEFLR